MANTLKQLERIGFDPRYLDKRPEALDGHEIARVVAVHKDKFTISNGELEVPAELVGKMLYSADSPNDFPTVGDWVLAGYHDGESFAVIHGLLPRKSLLKRKTPGKRIDFQLVAANIDVAFIVQSLDANFNLRRLERYLVMIHEARIEPILLLSKSDLMSAEEIAAHCEEIRRILPDLHLQPFSSEDKSGVKAVADLLTCGRTYCLLGSSGVGKTTLLNHLVGGPVFRTRAIRGKDGKGRHATTHRQLTVLDCGAMVVDTPGMRELGNFSVSKGLGDTFAEITALSQQCRFSDCAHVNEAGCAVLNALEKGQLSAKRYENYIKMNRESKHNEMSYYEKRMKDKQFGKMVKTVMKHKINKR